MKLNFLCLFLTLPYLASLRFAFLPSPPIPSPHLPFPLPSPLPYLTLPYLTLPYLTSLYSTVFVLFLYVAQPAGTGNTGSAPAPAGEGQPGNQPGNPPGGGEMGTSYIQVTPEERQAIERVRD